MKIMCGTNWGRYVYRVERFLYIHLKNQLSMLMKTFNVVNKLSTHKILNNNHFAKLNVQCVCG